MLIRTVSDKVLHDNVFNIAKSPNYDRYQGSLASMVYEFFNERPSAMHANKFAGGAIKSEIMLNQQLAKELYKPIIKKFEKRKVN